MVSRVVLDLVELVGPTPLGGTVRVPVGEGDVPVAAAWCERTGNELVSVADDVVVVRRGRTPRAAEVRRGMRRFDHWPF
jgi:hypothetical protein